MQHPQPKPGAVEVAGCIDSEQLCADWSESGECERAPAYMVGTAERPGKCVKSCGRCDLFVTAATTAANAGRSNDAAGDKAAAIGGVGSGSTTRRSLRSEMLGVTSR